MTRRCGHGPQDTHFGAASHVFRRAPHTRRDRKTEHGYSLVELLVVLVILALLVGLVAPRVIGYLGRARSQTAEVQIKSLETSLDMFLVDTGRYPTPEEGLDALLRNNGDILGWSGPYLQDETVPLDPWGRAYHYTLSENGQGVRVFTLGADGADGGDGENADVG